MEPPFSLAPDVVLHRIRLNYEALADGKRGDDVLQEILHDLARGQGQQVRVARKAIRN